LKFNLPLEMFNADDQWGLISVPHVRSSALLKMLNVHIKESNSITNEIYQLFLLNRNEMESKWRL